MAISAEELAAQVTQTRAFIEADPVELAVSRRITERAAGGGVTASEPLPAGSRAARLIAPGVPTEVRHENGTTSRLTYFLISFPGVTWKIGDTFTYNGDECEITSVQDLEYEIRCEVITRGR
jgi:hypothetical protein